MPDEREPESTAEIAAEETDDEAVESYEDTRPVAGTGAEPSSAGLFSVYGVLSTVLGLVSVAAVVFGVITWLEHHDAAKERSYRSHVLQTAASWTHVLINLTAENADKGLQQLHEKTAGQLNQEFEASMQPYREVVQRIQSRSTGRVEAVAIDDLHRDSDRDSGEGEAGSVGQLASRTDPVLVVATSVAENVGGKPQTVHWALHLDISEIDGKLLVTGLRSIR